MKSSVAHIEYITGLDLTMSYHFQPLALFLIDVEMETKLNIQKQDMFLICCPISLLDQIILALQNAVETLPLMGSLPGHTLHFPLLHHCIPFTTTLV